MTNNIEFDTEKDTSYLSRKIIGSPTEPAMVRFFMKIGLGKTPKESLTILLIIALIGIAFSVYLFIENVKKNNIDNNPKYHLSPQVIEKLPLQIQEKLKNKQNE